MKNTMKPLFASLLLICGASAVAEDVSIPVPAGQQGSAYANEARPKSGMSMDQVNNRFGAPGQKIASVGEPPITRWVYDHYTVYFEHDHVIHSVLHSN
ncbi:MAG: hypothetical protein VYA55_18130 [Pseudomonadota bacterium]|nr:hypothetical protein [Pseudomonadota bacterium]